MEFQVLGPVEIWAGDQTADAGHARQRAVLAVLLLDLGRMVPAARLTDRVWGEDPPPGVRNALYGYIARLRAVLAAAGGGATLSRRQGGYLLAADPEQLDLHRFRRMVGQAAAADDGVAEELLRGALGLWHGPALAGVDSPWLNAMRDTLDLERHAALLDLNDIRLRNGQHGALAAELVGQSAASPADERLIGQLMVALYRSGRQADALRSYDQTRRYLADELGTDPAPQLRELHQQILHGEPTLTLAARAATGKPAQPVPRELPPDVAAFTGRTAELNELDRILLRQQDQASDTNATAAVISAVSGTAGVGKTALGVHWAHHAADRFPDGQLYVNLRGYDPDQRMAAADALAGFLRSLGVPGQDIPPGEAERATRYRSLLAGKRMLIVLDNAATVEQVRPLLPGHPDCRVIVTSRDSLAGLVARDGARRLDLDLLPLGDAVALLRELIAARCDAEPDAAVTLAEHCARLPLALRIAAELAAARPDIPLASLIGGLGDEQHRLNLLEVGGDPRTAIRAVFSWSYDHLDIDAARAFRVAGLHPGADFDLYALTALTDATVDQARTQLFTVVRAHLIQARASGRYGMHDLLRAYAREQAAAGDADSSVEQCLTRLFDYYLSTATAAMDVLFPAEGHLRPRIPLSAAAGPSVSDEAGARAWLDSERANLVAVVVHCADHDWPAHATSLTDTLFRYLMNGSHLPEAHTIYSHMLRSARRRGDAAAEAAALNGLGGIGVMNGHFSDAASQYQAALERYRQCGDRAGQAKVLYNLGITEVQQHNPQSSASYQSKAIAAYEDTGDSLGAARALLGLADAETQLGYYDQAAEHLQRALAMVRDAKHQLGEAEALARIGELSFHRGQLTRAADFYQQALAIHHRIDYPVGVGAQLAGLGEVSLRQGRHPQAISYLDQALALFRTAGYQLGETETLRSLAKARHGMGEFAAARAELAAALRLAAETGNAYHQAGVHGDIAESHHSAGEDEQARHHWQRALALYTELKAPEADEVRAQLAALGDEET